MGLYNKESGLSAAKKSLGAACFYYAIQVAMNLAYRVILVQYFSVVYLGLDGLFANILTLLSLAELGVTEPIINRLYKPFKKQDGLAIRKYLTYYKTVYRYIFSVILFLGLVICPYIELFIKDISQVPTEINVYVLFLFFLFQTASTYLFAHYQSVLMVDRRQYTLHCMNTVVCLLRFAMQIFIVIYFGEYLLVVLVGIIVNILSNYAISRYVRYRYADFFLGNETLDKDIQKEILRDSRRVLVHRIGYKILIATDNIIISSFIGIWEVGLYSNYSLIVMYLYNLVNQLLGSLLGIVGNVVASSQEDYMYDVYKKLSFGCFWLTGTITVLLYTFLNPFILIWLGGQYCVADDTIVLLCIYFFISAIRIVPNIFVGVSHLFTRDVLRPVAQVIVNLVLSIVLVKRLGINGVILGSIACIVLTVFWREPYLLYKELFKKSFYLYWERLLQFAIWIIILSCGAGLAVKKNSVDSVLSLCCLGMCVFVLTQVVLIFVFKNAMEFSYYKDRILSVVNKERL